jgi:hypothetical protein
MDRFGWFWGSLWPDILTLQPKNPGEGQSEPSLEIVHWSLLPSPTTFLTLLLVFTKNSATLKTANLLFEALFLGLVVLFFP